MMSIGKDKVKHFFACFAMAAATALLIASICCNAGAAMVSGAIAGIAVGVGKEYGDGQAAGNRWDWQDIIADSLGAFVGCLLGLLALIM